MIQLLLLLILLGALLAMLKPYMEPAIFNLAVIVVILAVALYVLFPLLPALPRLHTSNLHLSSEVKHNLSWGNFTI